MAKPAKHNPHKPSVKHTLGEVLHSLQDLANNELAIDETANTANTVTTSKVGVQARQNPAHRPQKNREQVMRSLKALITADGDPQQERLQDELTQLAEDMIEQLDWDENTDAATDRHTQAEAQRPAHGIPTIFNANSASVQQRTHEPGGPEDEASAQQASPVADSTADLLDNAEELAPTIVLEPEAASSEEELEPTVILDTAGAQTHTQEDAHGVDNIDNKEGSRQGLSRAASTASDSPQDTPNIAHDGQLLIPGTETMRQSHSTRRAVEDDTERDSTNPSADLDRHALETMDLEDIPVLHHIAQLPPQAENATLAPSAPLPAPQAARDIAVRTIAKLNIELRKGGEPGLDPQIINRLQQLLREELEQQGTNMDNTPGSKRKPRA